MSDPLTDTLLQLNYELHKTGINFFLGGGFALFLKQIHLLTHSESRTLLPITAWPNPRSTQDIDLFLPLQVISSLADMQAVRAAMDELNFSPVPGSEYWQFLVATSQVKIDLLTGSMDCETQYHNSLNIDSRRVRPKGNVQLHAHPVPEAIDLAKNPETIPVSGYLSTDTPYSAEIHIPSPFTFLMMKLTAFGDQVENVNKQLGRHHALDVYRITAMLTEVQLSRTKEQFAEHSASPHVKRVKSIIHTHFADTNKVGALRIREHALFDKNMDVTIVIECLKDLCN